MCLQATFSAQNHTILSEDVICYWISEKIHLLFGIWLRWKMYLYMHYIVFKGKYVTQDPVLDYTYYLSHHSEVKFRRDALFWLCRKILKLFKDSFISCANDIWTKNYLNHFLTFNASVYLCFRHFYFMLYLKSERYHDYLEG